MKNHVLSIVKIFVLLIGISMMISCCPQRKVIRSAKSDSVRIVKETEYVEKIRWDTVAIPMPVEAKEVTTKQSYSFLETSLATSTARITEDGLLVHSIENKRQSVSVPVAVTDTVQKQKDETTQKHTEYVEVPVPREATRFEKFMYISGWALWAMIAFAVVWGIYKVLKK